MLCTLVSKWELTKPDQTTPVESHSVGLLQIEPKLQINLIIPNNFLFSKLNSKSSAILPMSMMHKDIMVGAFFHSTAVGKLRKDLPDVRVDARVNLPRYSLEEAAIVSHYYLRQRLVQSETFTEEKWKQLYYLSNGNGAEMKGLAPLMV